MDDADLGIDPPHRPPVYDASPPPSTPGLPFQDVLLALFKHKWKIIFCSLLGLIAAGVAYKLVVPLYESEARLLVKYVIDHTVVDQDEIAMRGRNQSIEAVIGSEVDILRSWDLALQVAKSERWVERGMAPTHAAAARRIRLSLNVTSAKGSNVIVASYKDRDPELAPAILGRLVEAYLAKHLKVHRPSNPAEAGLQSEKVNANLKATEVNLTTMKSEAGITSLDQGAASLTAELTKTQEQLRTAEAEFEQQRALVEALGGVVPPPSAPSADPAPSASTPTGEAELSIRQAIVAATPTAAGSSSLPAASVTDLENYQLLTAQSTRLRQKQLDLLGKFKPESTEVVTVRGQIQEVERQRKALVTQFPDLVARVPEGTLTAAPGRTFDLVFEQARLVGLRAKVDVLTHQFNDAKNRFSKYGENAIPIGRLERQRVIEEETVKYAAARVERAKIDAEMNPKNMPNISPLQEPSPATPVTSGRKKIVLGLAGSGFAFGIGLALLLELLLNRTVKRPLELESRLDIPLMLSIPWISRNGHRHLQSGQNGRNGRAPTGAVARRAPVAPWDFSHFIRPFSEVVRDRLAMFFEFNGLHHKPKLVGVAGFSEGAGASTLAGGLAAALSETGDGKVLLVDMNIGQAQAHSFFKGQAAYSLTTAIQSSNRLDSAADNLYLATVNPENDAPIPVGLRKFHAMMPGLKASGYDYIIFDMPHLSQTSPTMAMAAYMDKMLLVVAAETSDRDVVKRRHSELIASKARVSVIFNKARHYGPKWLESET